MTIEEIIALAKEDPTRGIRELKNHRTSALPDVALAAKQIDPLQHEVYDPAIRPDKLINNNDGQLERTERVARVALALQKLIVKRAVSFLFGNDVILNAKAESDVQKSVLTAVKRILYDNKAKSLNKQVARVLFSCTEVAEVWFPSEKKHDTYGFSSDFKIRSQIFSPLDGNILYPCFDEYGDMIAFSREFTRQQEKSKVDRYFETYTDTEHYLWLLSGSEGVAHQLVDGYPKQISIGKIPVVYATQPQVEWADVHKLIERLEKLLSNFADTNDYHASPKIVVTGDVKGFSKKGEAGAIIELEGGATASYLSWQNAPESVKLEIGTLLQMIYTITQTPDISFESVKGLGAMSGVALKLLFLDAHLKVNDKTEIFDKYIQRRLSIIKSFVGMLSTELKKESESMMIEHVIVPYMIEDEEAKVNMLVTGTGGKAVLSQELASQILNLSPDGKDDFIKIKQEEEIAAKLSVFSPTH